MLLLAKHAASQCAVLLYIDKVSELAIGDNSNLDLISHTWLYWIHMPNNFADEPIFEIPKNNSNLLEHETLVIVCYIRMCFNRQDTKSAHSWTVLDEILLADGGT